ncbi:hypothetical protein LTR28_010937, partial [Elasticomyces elasticus]
MLQTAPLLAIGTLDVEGRPWTTVWGGDAGFARPLGQSIIGIRTPVPRAHDPVVEILVGGEGREEGEVVREAGQGRMIGGLAIDLDTRKRVKIYGRMVAGALGSVHATEPEEERDDTAYNTTYIADAISGNCPKYLNNKTIRAAPSSPKLISESTNLPPEALALIKKADLFFLSTSNSTHDMDTNHRGGPPGFVRVLSNDSSGAVLVWPEYSGNRLYQSLGNLSLTPLAGLCFPDFETGDMLYVTGRTDILVGPDAAALLLRSNLAVKLTITAARIVANILPFRGLSGDPSPYNPVVRHLAHERPRRSDTTATTAISSLPTNSATLLSQTALTPTISRFHFSLTSPATYTAGQYVTLDFSSHLDTGYEHMRDDDPRSLNDDFVRTFTVSSPPGLPPRPSHRLADDEFAITIRRVGVVTGLLFAHGGAQRNRPREKLEVVVKGFDGAFAVAMAEGESVGFVAAGVGVTPLLPCLGSLDLARLRLVWTLRMRDLGLVLDTFARHPELAERTVLFLTGGDAVVDTGEEKEQLGRVRESGAHVLLRRLCAEDLLAAAGDEIER